MLKDILHGDPKPVRFLEIRGIRAMLW